MKIKCSRCGYEWMPRTENPIKVCKQCQHKNLVVEFIEKKKK